MKKRILLTSLFTSLFVSLQAKTVDYQQAADVAAKAIGTIPPQNGMGVSAVPENRLTLVKFASTESNYYVFNEADGNGFVIVSGDDVAKPVLGYSDKGSYDENNLPPAFAYWLDFLNREILYAVQNNFPGNSEWESFSGFRTTEVVVEPLIKTTWNQTAPYNNLCPEIDGKKTYTGCVATAMAQIMKFHNYPPVGIGQSKAYISDGGADVPVVDFEELEYDWESMLNYYEYFGTESDIEKNAVATLMYHCGVAVKMDYGLEFSYAYTTDAAKALVNTFGYDRKILFRDRFFYDNDEWEYMLKEQIDKRLPIMYRAADTENNGHLFICDGYDNMGYFHFNWGWGGNCDGYFTTTALNPYDEVTFNAEQMIVINIMPEEGGEPLTDISMWPEKNLTASHTAVDRRQRFTVTGSFVNFSLFDFKGYIGIALVDNDDQIIEIIGQQSRSIPSRLGLDSDRFTVSVSSNVASGNYKIREVAKFTNSSEWTFVRSTSGNTDVLDLTVKVSVGIAEVSSLKNITVSPNPAENILHISGENISFAEVTELSGKVLLSTNSTTINIANLQSGIYLIVIRTENGIVTKKMVKR